MWLQWYRVNRYTDWHWPINSLKLIHHEAAQFQLYITPETHHSLHYFDFHSNELHIYLKQREM